MRERWLDGKETKLVVQKIACSVDDIKCLSYTLSLPPLITLVFAGRQVRESLRRWVTSPDPSTNHTIACGIQHDGSAQWFFRGSIFSEWKSTSSLLWIHGKRMFVLVHARPIADHLHILSRLREEHPLVSRRSNLYRSKTSLPWRVVLQSSRTYKHHAKRD